MLRTLEFLSGFYWILIPQFIIKCLLRVRWREAYHTRGTIGLVEHGIGGAFGFNAVAFYVDVGGAWSGHRIKRLLASYEIPIWGWGFAFGQYYFHVHADDADSAQDILLMAGVELLY